MDEPTGSIDPIATAAVEELIVALRDEHTIVVVTHSMRQTRRIADRVAYFHLGRLLEVGPTRALFENAQQDLVRRFIAGKYGSGRWPVGQ
jgi:phosphate transport system ATP-binding protein